MYSCGPAMVDRLLRWSPEDAPAFAELLERNPGKRGNATLRIVLDLPGGPARTRSPAERRMLRLLREAGLTGYELNLRIHGFEVDVL